jgi:hypothetical protein
VLNDGTNCPKFPQPFFSAPSSTSVFGHHSYPGGLVIHESNNDVADVHLADEYRQVYGHAKRNGFPTVDVDDVRSFSAPEGDDDFDIFINEDLIIGAPLWHDWAKPIVFQWNANGTEFVELNLPERGGPKDRLFLLHDVKQSRAAIRAKRDGGFRVCGCGPAALCASCRGGRRRPWGRRHAIGYASRRGGCAGARRLREWRWTRLRK